MIRSSDRDFTYDALDRPVQAGTARMRYDGFSDEVVTDGTQSFGRSASDGLLSMGYDTTKRLVMADRHGDIIAGFDPTDTTLSTGLPDTRTYDPFGNSTNATGLKYRVGYQGDWTDPRSGDVNQGARWYNPDSATFNSRDTMTYAGGSASSLPNLYAYAGGNPLTYNDPDGHRPIDPENGGALQAGLRTWRRRSIPHQVVGCQSLADQDLWTCSWNYPRNLPPETRWRLQEDVRPMTAGRRPGGCKKNCGSGGGDGDCNEEPVSRPARAASATPTPPPPPKCDKACQAKKLRNQLDDDAINTRHPPTRQPILQQRQPVPVPHQPGRPVHRRRRLRRHFRRQRRLRRATLRRRRRPPGLRHRQRGCNRNPQLAQRRHVSSRGLLLPTWTGGVRPRCARLQLRSCYWFTTRWGCRSDRRAGDSGRRRHPALRG